MMTCTFRLLMLCSALLVPALGARAQHPIVAATSGSPGERLQRAVEKVAAGVRADWGIYVKCLETGEVVAVNADRQMDTMSVIKIPLMVEVFQRIKEGGMALGDRYTLRKEDIRPGTGTLRYLDPGAVVTVKDLVTLMIIVSDNTATDVLYGMVGGPSAVTRRMAAMGLTSTVGTRTAGEWFAAQYAAASAEAFHRSGRHPYGLSTPREIGVLLERMERGELVDADSSRLMLQIMRSQLYRTRIPRYLSGWVVPHKTGDFLPFIGNDAGVLESPGRTVVVSVFTANHFGDGGTLEDAIGRIAREVAAFHAYRP